MSEVLTTLSTLREGADDDLAPLFFQLEDQWERKLWYQLTETLSELFKDPKSHALQIPLFQQFVARLETSLNPLAFATFAVTASQSCDTADESLAFMKEVTAQMAKTAAKSEDMTPAAKLSAREVQIFMDLRVASLYVELNDVVPAKKILDQAKQTVDELLIADKAVLAQYYGVACEFYKHQSDYTSYYRYALLLLSVLNVKALDSEQKQQRAYDLCIAALLADKIFNFGELVLHPIIQSLVPDHQWLYDLVLSVNGGDIPRFQQLRATLSEKSTSLRDALPFLEQKICLMALCECVFRRQATDRVLTFATIAKETHLQPGAKVEVLVMKAFSLGLMRGLIDEVAKTVAVTWLQPRALSLEQMATMRGRLAQWDADVKALGGFMAKHPTVA